MTSSSTVTWRLIRAARHAGADRRSGRERRRDRLSNALASPVAARPADLPPLVERLNPPETLATTSERAILVRHLLANRLPVAPVRGIVGRAGGWNPATGRPVQGQAEVARLLDDGDDDLLLAPSRAGGGAPLVVLRRTGSALVQPDGARTTPADLAEGLVADPDQELFVVMSLPPARDDLRRLPWAPEVPAVRVTSLVADSGEVELVHAHVRPLGGGASAGPCRRAHPVSGAVEDARPPRPRLPHWPATRALVRRAAILFMPQRTIAWDLLLTPRGPVVVDVISRYPWIDGVGFGDVVRRLRRTAVPRDREARP